MESQRVEKLDELTVIWVLAGLAVDFLDNHNMN